MSLDELRDGKIFSVWFVKKTDGTVRKLRGRYGVHKGTSGKGMRFDPEAKGLMVVWDLEKKDYRMVPLANIIKAHHHGREEVYNECE